jgi:peptide/nickel transport system substrate-binding protein
MWRCVFRACCIYDSPVLRRTKGAKLRTAVLRSIVVASMTAALAVGAGATSIASASTSQPAKAGGTLQVEIVASQWPGLDSATDTQDTADAAYLNEIYGQLFEMTANNVVVPDQATSWKLTNHNSTLVFTLRKSLVFSNGDPFTAADVAWSINRDTTPSFGNIGLSNLPLTAAGCSGSGLTVTCPLKEPDVAIVPAFINEAWNWTVDQSALTSMGEAAYAQNPIGAGPFKVATNEASAELNLVKNTKYWEKGHPLLAGIDFTNVSSDQSALDALQSGEAQLAMGVTTIPLLNSVAKQSLSVTKLPAMVTEFINFNTIHGPFSNVLAREAASYATNSKALVAGLYEGAYKPVESQTAPGQLFYTQTNKYYHGYNLAKAKKLVAEIPGGLSVDLSTTLNDAFFINEVQAIATMWEAAGIKVTIQDYSLQQMLGITFSGAWQAIDENWGVGTDPGINDSEFFANLSAGTVFSGNNNADLQGLLNQGLANANPIARQRVYTEVGNVENQQDLADFLYAKNAYIVSTKSLGDTGDFTPNQFNIFFENMSLG